MLTTEARAVIEDRGMHVTQSAEKPHYVGSIFRASTAGVVVEHATTTSGRFVDMGEFQYPVSSGEGRSTVMRWGFIAIHLDRPLPHIIVEARGRDTWFTGGLPFDVNPDQRLSFEGDFDEYFSLYCPADYGVDALYIFAPDLMSLLIDETGGKHVEIAGEWMFIMWQLDPGQKWHDDIHRLLRIIDVVGTKAVRQTRAYVDDNPVASRAVLRSTSRVTNIYVVTFAITAGAIVLGMLGIVVVFAFQVFSNLRPPF